MPILPNSEAATAAEIETLQTKASALNRGDRADCIAITISETRDKEQQNSPEITDLRGVLVRVLIYKTSYPNGSGFCSCFNSLSQKALRIGISRVAAVHTSS